jgi:hypothetical protein
MTTLAMVLAFAMAAGGESPPAARGSKTARDPAAAGDSKAARGFTIASYYFPNYHPGDPRNEARRGKGWCEWELVKSAKPRFPGHQQPNLPAWGTEDESDPAVMARKIDAAADHGVDAFIFDWYWYDDGPFLDRALERGFLKASNNRRLRFALMWANHDWTDIHPRTLKHDPPLLYRGRISPTTFERMTDHIIAVCFKHPSHWKIAGRPYFSVYDLTALVASFGSLDATRQALEHFRAKTKAAGFPDLHLNAVVWGNTILPGEQKPADAAAVIKALGFDSVTSYVWIHHVALPDFPATDYGYVKDKYFEYWAQAEKMFGGVPYYPNATMGWDSSPRADPSDPFINAGYPFMATIGGNTPERFREALEQAKERLAARPPAERILTINCWNEWTEGSYLEPDTRSGMKYLEAVKSVFGAGSNAGGAPRAGAVKDKPGLPRILLIGDSISIGYTPRVHALLEGKANVHRPPVNCASTKHGLEAIDSWLGKGPWDVIHFNWGLHDLKHVDARGQMLDKSKGGTHQVPLPQYEKNLAELVRRLKETGAALIWCSTTPVPEGAGGRIAGEEKAYNESAGQIAREQGLRVNDLWSLASSRPDGIQIPRNVHFTPRGYDVLAEQVADSIVSALARRPLAAKTRVSLADGKWHIGGTVTYPGTRAEGLLMNVRMVNSVFEDRNRPDFDPEANTSAFVAKIPDYAAHGVRAFTICLQGGMPDYEGALNSAFEPDGSLRDPYLARVRRVIEACDKSGLGVILGCFYQRQDQILRDEAAVRGAVAGVTRWIKECGFANVCLEIANEFEHGGFDHKILRTPEGEVELIRLAKREAPDLLVSTSGLGHGRLHDPVCEASDFLLVHYNGVPLEEIPRCIEALEKFRKPIVCNEDDKPGEAGARAAELSVKSGASWGCMLKEVNQFFPFSFKGAADDPVIYAKIEELTSRPRN